VNLKEFINKEIKIGYSKYDYFEIEKSNPAELEKLSGLELQYLENRYVIYKEKNMDSEYQIHTYIFDDNELYLLTTDYCYTKEKKYDFYIDNQISKTVNYYFEIKSSLTQHDKNGGVSLKVSYPLSQSDRLSGYRYKSDKKIPMELFELEKYL